MAWPGATRRPHAPLLCLLPLVPAEPLAHHDLLSEPTRSGVRILERSDLAAISLVANEQRQALLSLGAKGTRQQPKHNRNGDPHQHRQRPRGPRANYSRPCERGAADLRPDPRRLAGGVMSPAPLAKRAVAFAPNAERRTQKRKRGATSLGSPPAPQIPPARVRVRVGSPL